MRLDFKIQFKIQVLQADKVHTTFSQTTVFVRIFLQICNDNIEFMDDDDKCVMMTIILLYIQCIASYVHTVHS